MSGSTGGPHVTCASLESQAGRDFLQATAVCDPSTPPNFTTDRPKLTTVSFQQPLSSLTNLKNTPTSQNHFNKGRTKRDMGILPFSCFSNILLLHMWMYKYNLTNFTKWCLLPISIPQPQLDQTPVLGNTWKFTTCVAALALCTFMLIVCAIKGPSWYKLFHDYRHRRLRQQEDEDYMSTVFTETRRYLSHQTFTFEQENGQTGEGEEDGYFEDPYIKREEWQEGKETSAEPWRSKQQLGGDFYFVASHQLKK